MRNIENERLRRSLKASALLLEVLNNQRVSFVLCLWMAVARSPSRWAAVRSSAVQPDSAILLAELLIFEERKDPPVEQCTCKVLSRDPSTQGPNPGNPETLGEQHRDLPMDPWFQESNLGNPGIPLGHRDLPIIPRTQDPNPGTPRKPFGTQRPLQGTRGLKDRNQRTQEPLWEHRHHPMEPRPQGPNPGFPGNPLRTQGPPQWPMDSGTEPREPGNLSGNQGSSHYIFATHTIHSAPLFETCSQNTGINS